jgi:hypothetical protein
VPLRHPLFLSTLAGGLHYFQPVAEYLLHKTKVL